ASAAGIFFLRVRKKSGQCFSLGEIRILNPGAAAAVNDIYDYPFFHYRLQVAVCISRLRKTIK
ncbi:MAG: hypothetical protein IKD69_11205, partial [Solobacterium sp.]|nr:hypothetical protein [Solobacterium sp.]